jgi:hypothetical protein
MFDCHLICVERPLAVLLGRHFGWRALLRILPRLGYKHTRHRPRIAIAASAARATAATNCEPAGQVHVGTGASGETSKASARRRRRHRPRGRGWMHGGSIRRVEGCVLRRCNQRLGRATQKASVRLLLALTAQRIPVTRSRVFRAAGRASDLSGKHPGATLGSLSTAERQGLSPLDPHPSFDLCTNRRRYCIDRGRSSCTHDTDVNVVMQVG